MFIQSSPDSVIQGSRWHQQQMSANNRSFDIWQSMIGSFWSIFPHQIVRRRVSERTNDWVMDDNLSISRSTVCTARIQGDHSFGRKLLGFAKWIAHSTLSSSPFGHFCFVAIASLESRPERQRESRMCDPFCKAQQFPTEAAISLLVSSNRNANLSARKERRLGGFTLREFSTLHVKEVI